jgi:hypothetical protein
LAIKIYKSKKIQTSFHLVGVWNLMWDLKKEASNLNYIKYTQEVKGEEREERERGRLENSCQPYY